MACNGLVLPDLRFEKYDEILYTICMTQIDKNHGTERDPASVDAPGSKRYGPVISSMDVKVNDVLEIRKDDPRIQDILHGVQGNCFQVIGTRGDEVELKPTTASSLAPRPTGESVYIPAQFITPVHFRQVGHYHGNI
jgi:hypothetical protein